MVKTERLKLCFAGLNLSFPGEWSKFINNCDASQEKKNKEAVDLQCDR